MSKKGRQFFRRRGDIAELAETVMTKKGRQVFQEKIDWRHPQLPPRVSPTLVTPLAFMLLTVAFTASRHHTWLKQYTLHLTNYPHKWSPVSCKSSEAQGKFAGKIPTFYHCATQTRGI